MRIKRITKNQKYAIAAGVAVVGVLAVAIPLAVVYGSPSSDTKETVIEETQVTRDVTTGTTLADLMKDPMMKIDNYTAEVDTAKTNYTATLEPGAKDIKVFVTYTPVIPSTTSKPLKYVYTMKIQPTAFVNEVYNDEIITNPEALALPEPRKPTNVPVGYLQWVASYKKGTANLDLAGFKTLNHLDTFVITYTAQPNSAFNLTSPATVTVNITAKVHPTVFLNETHDIDIEIVADADFPKDFKPSVNPVGYLPWVTSYKQGTKELTVNDLRALTATQKFVATYTANIDSTYAWTQPTLPAIVTVNYTVKQTPVMSEADKHKTIDSGKIRRSDNQFPTLLQEPATIKGWLPWSTKKYTFVPQLQDFSPTVVATYEEWIATAQVGSQIAITYTALPDAVHSANTGMILRSYFFTLEGIPVPSATDQTTNLNHQFGTDAPTTFNNLITPPLGYLSWNNSGLFVQILPNGDEPQITAAQVKALAVGSKFAIDFAANFDSKFYVLNDGKPKLPANLRLIYTVV